MFFSQRALLVWQRRRAPRRWTWSLADREVFAALGEGPMTRLDLLTAIGGTKSLSALDGFARAIWTDWGAGTAHRRAGERAGGDAGGPQARGAGDRHRGDPGAAGGRGRQSRAARAIFHPSGRRRARRTGGRRSSGGGRWRRPAPCRRSSPANSRPASWRRCGSSPTPCGTGALAC